MIRHGSGRGPRRSGGGVALLALAASGLVSGCAGSTMDPLPANVYPGYLFAGRACSEINQLSAQEFHLDEDTDLVFGAKSQCLSLGDRLDEPASLLELPDSGAAYYIAVDTRRGRHMVIPRAEFLDAGRREIRGYSYRHMKSVGNGMTLTLFVRSGTQRPRYLLLLPDPSLVGKTGSRLKQDVGIAYYSAFSVPYGTSQEASTVDVEQGTLRVRVERYSTPEVKRTGSYGRGH